MSLFDDASLVMIPDGAKDGTLYSVKPTDATGDFTFTRGSNLAATRVDENGLIEKGRENLLLQSNQFDTTWFTFGSSITSGQSGYDGTNDAWLLESTTTGESLVKQNFSAYSGVQTLSFFAKQGTASKIRLVVVGGGNPRAHFDLSDGTIHYTPLNIDTKITSIGNGWYRCSFTFVAAITEARVQIVSANDGTNNNSAIGDTIYIQDAQLEVGLVATDYIETGATTAQAGILEDLPRLDYSGGASCPALLLEPQRTNKMPHSEYFEDSGFGKISITLEGGYLAPDGTNSAYKITATSPSLAYLVYNSIALADDARSIYARSVSGTGTAQLLSHNSNTNNLFTLTEEWQRFELNSTPLISTNFYPVDFRGSGTLTELYIWGAQLEAGSYPTSYIPTYGSSVTRSADSCSKTGISSLIGQSEGTLFVEFQQDYISAVNGFASLSDGSTTNRITVNTVAASSTEYTFSIAMNYSGSGTVLMNSDITYNDKHKAVIVYSGTTAKMFIDGSQVDTNTTTGFGNYDRFIIGQNQLGGSAQEERELYNAILFPTALSDAECIALTTI